MPVVGSTAGDSTVVAVFMAADTGKFYSGLHLERPIPQTRDRPFRFCANQCRSNLI
jgi:hypothetical protein